jgi:hypothetical protein
MSDPLCSGRHAEHCNNQRGGTSHDERNYDPVVSLRLLFTGRRSSYLVPHGSRDAFGSRRCSGCLVICTEGSSRRIGVSDFIGRATPVDGATQYGWIGTAVLPFPIHRRVRVRLGLSIRRALGAHSTRLIAIETPVRFAIRW